MDRPWGGSPRGWRVALELTMLSCVTLWCNAARASFWPHRRDIARRKGWADIRFAYF